jgi:hypothetical protein
VLAGRETLGGATSALKMFRKLERRSDRAL